MKVEILNIGKNALSKAYDRQLELSKAGSICEMVKKMISEIKRLEEI